MVPRNRFDSADGVITITSHGRIVPFVVVSDISEDTMVSPNQRRVIVVAKADIC